MVTSQEFGLCNYNSWEVLELPSGFVSPFLNNFQVAEIHTICRLKGWVVPTAYQGAYNILARGPELE